MPKIGVVYDIEGGVCLVAYLKDGSFDEIDLPDLEDIDRVAHSLGVCLSAFSKKPFDEKWSIGGLLSPGLLLNPRTTSHLVKKLFRHDECIIKVKPDGGEQFTVKAELILRHIEETLSDPMTGFLLDTGWFALSDINKLKYIQNELINKKLAYTVVDTVYPLTELLGKYVDASKGTYSLLTLGYHENWSYESMSNHHHQVTEYPTVGSELKMLRITQDTVVPENIYPRFAGRYLTLNHPGLTGKINVADHVVLETKQYLNKEEQEVLLAHIVSDYYTTFLGEVAKIPDNDKVFKAIHFSGLRYLEILTDKNDKTSKLEPKDLVPKQMLYMSLPGTSVASESKAKRGESRLFQSLMMLTEPFGLEYKEDVCVFSKPDGQAVLFGVIKQI